MAAEREVELDPLLERVQPQLVEPVGLAAAGAEQRRVGQRRAAEQRERLAQQLAASSGGASRGARDQRLEAVEVERLGSTRSRSPTGG